MLHRERENSEEASTDLEAAFSLEKGVVAGLGLAVVAYESGRIHSLRRQLREETQYGLLGDLQSTSDISLARIHVQGFNQMVEDFASQGYLDILFKIVDTKSLTENFAALRRNRLSNSIRNSVLFGSLGVLIVAPAIYDGVKLVSRWIQRNSE